MPYAVYREYGTLSSSMGTFTFAGTTIPLYGNVLSIDRATQNERKPYITKYAYEYVIRHYIDRHHNGGRITFQGLFLTVSDVSTVVDWLSEVNDYGTLVIGSKTYYYCEPVSVSIQASQTPGGVSIISGTVSFLFAEADSGER
jgi:hypothetical protein